MARILVILYYYYWIQNTILDLNYTYTGTRAHARTHPQVTHPPTQQQKFCSSFSVLYDIISSRNYEMTEMKCENHIVSLLSQYITLFYVGSSY